MPVRRPADRSRLLRRVISQTLASIPGFSGMAHNVSGAPSTAGRTHADHCHPDYRLDALETRRLMTTLAGGGMLNGMAQSNEFVFRDADDNAVRISLRGNVLAEFIFLRVDGDGAADGALDNNNTRIVDLVPFIRSGGGNPGNGGQGADLFSVYVAQADANSSIVVSEVAVTTTGFGAAIPFGSDGGSIRFADAGGGAETVDDLPATTGSILLGARTKALDDVDNGPNAGDVLIPNRFNTAAIGVRPASLGRVFAGLETARGQKLGKFYFGGTVTGRVKVADSMGEFYAGNVLTGEANQALIGNGSATSPEFGLFISGTTSSTGPTDPGNFYVAGDLEQLLVLGNVGSLGVNTDDATPEGTFGFKSGFSARIGGRLGSANVKGSIVGGFTVMGSNSIRTRGLAQREIEQRVTTLLTNETYFEGPTLAGFIPSLSDQPLFFNDSIATAQYLGTFYNKELRSANAIQVTGTIGGGESVDYYSVPLMAGQTVSTQVLSDLLLADDETSPFYSLGVFDPDGRLIISDNAVIGNFNSSFTGTLTGSKMQFTADRPGLYYFAVGLPGDRTFTGSASTGGLLDYELRINNVGALSVGTIAARAAIATFDTRVVDPFDPDPEDPLNPDLARESLSFEVRGGDLGAILSSGGLGLVANNVGSGIIARSTPYSVRNGSLRVLQGTSVGIVSDAFFDFRAPDLLVPFGNVGLVRSTAGILALNPNFADPLAPGQFDDFDPDRAIGGSYQLVEASGDLLANLGAKKGIGVIRAGTVGNTFSSAPRWAVNTDNSGNDGTIDLVFVSGDLGTLGGGGPQISTGAGGNVRYMRVLGTVYRDVFFGGGNPDTITSLQGRTVSLTDDSGTQVDLIPPPDPDGAVGTLGTPGAISATTYGIRDKGGSVLIDVAVSAASGQLTDGFGTITGAGGLTVRSRAAGSRGSVEIGNVIVNGIGSTTTYTRATRTFTNVIGNGDDLQFTGNVPVDVFQITANGIAPGLVNTLGNVTNTTTGELVNISASQANVIEAQSIGLSRSRTGTEVGGAARGLLFPFSTTQRNLVEITGDVVAIRSRRGIGAVLVGTLTPVGAIATEGTIGQLRPNSDGRKEAGYFEGIDAPIMATGDLVDVNIGEGMNGGLGSSFSRSGLFAGTLIGTITNQGLGSDIRGDIVVQGANSGPIIDPLTGLSNGFAQGGLDRIVLRDGAIINANIIVGFTVGPGINPNQVVDDITPVGLLLTDFDISPEAPTFDTGSIVLNGKGGIISSRITTSDVGFIRINGGFGFINSSFITGPTSNNAGIITDGYGVRNSSISGAILGRIQANGNGRLLSTTDFTPTVRASEVSSIDPNTGLSPNSSSDLHLFLGTTRDRPRRSDASEAGTIADSIFTGQRDLGTVEAWRIRGHQPDPENPIPVSSSSFPMRISFANSAGTIRVREKIDGLNLSAGSIKLLQTGNDMGATYVSVSGKITDVVVKGSILSSSTINATGPDGRIDRIQTGKRLVGRVQTSLDLKNLLIGTDLFSRQVIVGRNLYKLNVAGDVKAGSNLRVGDRLSELRIGDDLEAGATLAARRIGIQFIGGEVDGDLVIG